jgi:hypothetical protein
LFVCICKQAGKSVITIRNLKNAKAAQGTMQLLSGPNQMDQHMFFSDSFAETGTRGKGRWDQQSGNLQLFVVQDIECTTDIQFRFRVENPSCEQEAPTPVTVEASNVGLSATIFNTGVSIASAKMDYDLLTVPLKGFGVGDSAPMKVCPLRILSANVQSSSSVPCATSTITVSNLQTNVPIIPTANCVPTITIKGLTNMIQTSQFLPLVAPPNPGSDTSRPIHADYLSSSSPSSSDGWNKGTWSNTCAKSLVVFVRKTLPTLTYCSAGLGSDCSSVEYSYSFAFDVLNPAKPQPAVSVSIEVNGNGNVGASCQPVVYTALGSAASVTAAVPQARVRQSSPFPCDNNTISVEFKANVDM